MKEVKPTKINNKNFIKHLKPKKNGFYKQGVIDPKTCSKYYSNRLNEPIIYRSGLELQFIQYCEASNKIAKWGSEIISIPYTCRLDNKEHDYYPDYIIENDNGTRCIVEVKPANQTVKPNATDNRWLKESWIRNIDKWNAAKEFADKHNMKFIIVTENFFK